MNKYNDALEYIEQKEYDKAEEIFKNLDDFKDSSLQKELIEVHKYLDNDNYEDAFKIEKSEDNNVNNILFLKSLFLGLNICFTVANILDHLYFSTCCFDFFFCCC